ncbi:MAG: PBECR4 domain-containing protein [Lachnospiraceae bacterium]|nr:PBECR4 domain-containing protein [Lachnospiraceae bacterium]
MQSLLQIFQDTKEVLCKYDYYIHIQKRILHLTNSETKIPHLMGLQYLGKKNQFSGDYGTYAIKKQRITMESVEKLVRKYYKTEEKQRRMLEMIYRKLDNLGELGEMFSSYSRLYLYEKGQNGDSEFQSDYLLVHENGKKILHLGLVKSKKGKDIYHCNSFMTTYQNDRDRDSFYRNLPQRYEIIKIVREDKDTKHKEVIYQSVEAEQREQVGIEKMMAAAGILADKKLIKAVMRLNKKFGIYLTIDMLRDEKGLLAKCTDKRDKVLVSEFLSLWEEKDNSV